jgi:hypothetical protein
LIPGWHRPFDNPIPLPRGRQLVTLRDAAEFITKLPKAEHDARNGRPRWKRCILSYCCASAPTESIRVGDDVWLTATFQLFGDHHVVVHYAFIGLALTAIPGSDDQATVIFRLIKSDEQLCLEIDYHRQPPFVLLRNKQRRLDRTLA